MHKIEFSVNILNFETSLCPVALSGEEPMLNWKHYFMHGLLLKLQILTYHSHYHSFSSLKMMTDASKNNADGYLQGRGGQRWHRIQARPAAMQTWLHWDVREGYSWQKDTILNNCMLATFPFISEAWKMEKETKVWMCFILSRICICTCSPRNIACRCVIFIRQFSWNDKSCYCPLSLSFDWWHILARQFHRVNILLLA